MSDNKRNDLKKNTISILRCKQRETTSTSEHNISNRRRKKKKKKSEKNSQYYLNITFLYVFCICITYR